MALGYDGKLYILAFDHRGSFQKKMFGIEGEPTPEQVATIADAKHLIYEGMEEAVKRGAEPGATGVLVDEQFGGEIPKRAHEEGLKLAMPVEKSGQNEFDFQYGDDFGAHIKKFDPNFSKVLVRYNPDDPDSEMNQRQLTRLKVLADWLHEKPDDSRAAHSGEAGGRAGGRRERKFLFELLVPATDDQLASVGGDTDRYDAELRPELMRRAIENIQNFGIEVDIWKIEGVDERADAEMLAEQTRSGSGREGVTCVLLGRGASTEKVGQWLQVASGVDGFIGFAIGRSIWWDALKAFLDKGLDRAAAASQIADNYLHFVGVYEHQQVA
ncbi:MAG TPA: DUF2090 domain-containing protein [Solirubrobacteraceae bacterium]|jgi:myo-inositol catabolism protein IolC|nr:DUF2090 domain-containing protein [Solirubrobacteraceae bacterium]